MMQTLTTGDLHLVVRRLPKDVAKLVKDEGLIVGGGFIRSTIAGEKPSDIDIFGPDKKRLEGHARRLAIRRDTRYNKTPNATTVLTPNRIPIQFVTRWIFEAPADVVHSFDFTVCMASIWYDAATAHWKSFIGNEFYPDLAARRLVYTSPQRNEDAGGSLMRVRKFLARGYNIQAPSLGAVVARLVMALKNRGEMDEEFMGQVLTGLLREVDPLVIIDGIDLVDEHEAIH
jgi:hypothetical protein